MTWLASILKPLFEVLLPFVFKKGPVVAEDSKQTDSDLRRSWASRITDIMRNEPTSRDDSPDHIHDSKRGTGSD